MRMLQVQDHIPLEPARERVFVITGIHHVGGKVEGAVVGKGSAKPEKATFTLQSRCKAAKSYWAHLPPGSPGRPSPRRVDADHFHPGLDSCANEKTNNDQEKQRHNHLVSWRVSFC